VLQKLESIRDVFDVRRDTPVRTDESRAGTTA
jgi:hypothetical protein